MTDRPAFTLTSTVLAGPDPHALAAPATVVEVAGATPARVQPQEDVRVYLDPAGHPFCLWTR